MVIFPNVDNTRVFTIVQFSVPRDQVDLDKQLDLIFKRDQIVGVGSYFAVQFLSHDKSTLISSALFILTDEKEQRVTSEADPYQPVSRDIKIRKAEQIGDWWFAEDGAAVEHPGPRKQPPPTEPGIPISQKDEPSEPAHQREAKSRRKRA